LYRNNGENRIIKTLDELLHIESTRLDLKEMLEVKKPKSWLKTVSAFANGVGGALIWGIADDKEKLKKVTAVSDSRTRYNLIKVGENSACGWG